MPWPAGPSGQKLDDWSWHLTEDYLAELDPVAAATRTANWSIGTLRQQWLLH
ncbi:MAG: hypothetical protein AAF513_14385 [Pseudomonadota bacterium]